MPDAAQWPRIEALYYDALDLPETERAAYLARVCAGEEAVRCEVESLLAARNEAGSFLSQPAFEPPLLSGAGQAALNARLGSTIGQYQLLSVLGVGGMGQVFLAEDTRLHRQVALKLLPPQFSQQPGRVRRFEQEARATTALNHPNIVTLYDTGQHEGSYFIVNEFVDGQTLRAHLNAQLSASRPLPVNEALNIAQQIATALAAAHAAGIVHRDIKPENVMLRHDGFVKVLDFGLAKLTGAALDSAQDDTHDEDNPPSAIGIFQRGPQSHTAAGALLGTIRYMSPEQARGGSVDARTDVFSLGVVLYEMLTGRTPFHRATATETLAAILEAGAPALPDSMPAPLQRLVTSVLRKDREQRLQTADELAAALRGVAEEAQFSARLAGEPWWRGWRWPLWAGLALLLTLAGYVVMQRRGAAPAADLAQLVPTSIADWKTEPEETGVEARVAPDERLLSYTHNEAGQRDLFVRALPDGAALNLTHDAGREDSHVWSPDGRELAYVVQHNGLSEVRRVAAQGGASARIAELNTPFLLLLRWSRVAPRLYYYAECGIHALDVRSGAQQQLLEMPGCLINQIDLSFDEQWVTYAADGQIWARPVGSGAPRQLTHEASDNDHPHWLPDGQRVVYSSNRNGVRQICVAYLDDRTPTQLTFGHEHLTPAFVSAAGRVFYRGENGEADLFRLELATRAETHLTVSRALDFSPTLAPAGQALAYQQTEELANLLSLSLWHTAAQANAQPVRLAAQGFDPRWSPRGAWVAFLRAQGDGYALGVVGADGQGERVIVPAGLYIGGYVDTHFGWNYAANFSWSPDGERLAYTAGGRGARNLWTVRRDGTQTQALTDNRDPAVGLFCPLWSPVKEQIMVLARGFSEGVTHYQLVVVEAGQTRVLWETDQRLAPLGWSRDGQQFLVVAFAPRGGLVRDGALLQLNAATGRTETRAALAAVYTNSVQLAPAGAQAAFVARRNQHDELWSVALATGRATKHLSSADPYLYLTGLVWSPDARAIFFSKQSHAISLWAIDNFR
ncbi:MAG: protein kinase [Acidobacteria bacterium]|nr:protein kinase [Acidobacteriota bacterium]